VGIALLERDKRVIGGVLPLPFGKCVKYGRTVQLSEVTNLQFVAKKILIPVPKVCREPDVFEYIYLGLSG
jgi:hypothetical protein